ncbi:MAG: dTMP kinase [Bacillota bacterium]
MGSLNRHQKQSQLRGLLISIEGIDGAGKSTIAGQLERKFIAEGYPVQLVREPGGTIISERIRELLLDPGNQQIAAKTEALLYAAARAQLVAEVIQPNLEAGQLVICDRYTDSTLAYQGGGRGIDLEWLRDLNRLATGGVQPEVTLLLDLDPQIGRNRRSTRQGSGRPGEDRLEAESEAFYHRVRETYLQVAREEPQRLRVVDASKPLPEVVEEAWEILAQSLNRKTNCAVLT